MGTRADFYVGRGEDAEWLGSIAWDGYPDGIDEYVISAQTEAQYRSSVKIFAKQRDDWTAPESGWPWPWEDSRTTDYAYAFDGDKVYASASGHDWFNAAEPEPDDEEWGDKTAVFPNMRERQNVTLGKRSGLIVLGGE